MSPFLAHRTFPSAGSQAEGMSPRMGSTGTDLTQPQKCTGLQIGVDVLVLLVKIGLVHNISSLADLVVYILADFSGLLKVYQYFLLKFKKRKETNLLDHPRSASSTKLQLSVSSASL